MSTNWTSELHRTALQPNYKSTSNHADGALRSYVTIWAVAAAGAIYVHRGGRPAHHPAVRHGHTDLQPAGRRLAVRSLAEGCHVQSGLERPPKRSVRHVQPREPAQARRRRRAGAGGRAGRYDPCGAGDRLRHQPSRCHLRDRGPADHGTAGVLPARSRAHCAGRVLDRIDELVAPGVTINPDDNSYGTHELTTAARRRG